MKVIVFYLLSAVAIASPQDSTLDLDRVLAETFEEIGLATRELAEAQEAAAQMNGSAEARYAQLGLISAETELGLAVVDNVTIGITGGPPSEALCSHLKLDAKQSLIVNSVVPGMSAAKAGLHEHDIIIGIGGDPGATIARLRETLSTMEVGYVLELRIIRHGKPESLPVPLLETQTGYQQRAGSGGGYWGVAATDPYSREFALALSDFATDRAEATRVESELARAQAQITAAEREIDTARMKYEAAIAELQRDRNDKAQSVDELRALEHYENLITLESNRLTRMRALELRMRALREGEQERAEALEAQTEPRFVNDGRWEKLVIPDRSSRQDRGQDSTHRIESVEHRVDELHARFDRFEKMLERIAGRRDN